jgi:hypothetical protein
MPGTTLKKVSLILVFTLLALGLGRAAKFRWQEKEDALRQAFRAQAGGATQNCPTPEILMITGSCIPAGGTGEVVIKGKFPPGTKFVFENDILEVVNESLAGNIYKATVKVPMGAGPQKASVMAITPCGKSARHDGAVVVSGKYDWDLQASNGWRIQAKFQNDTRCNSNSGGGESTYNLLFFKGNETAPFEKRQATLQYSMWERTQYRFSIDQTDSSTRNIQEEMQQMMKKMMDPNLSEAERDRITKKIETIQKEMIAEMQKMSNPAEAQKQIQKMEQKKLEFGCDSIELQVTGSNAQGNMRCSEKVGRNLAVTGSMKYLGQ